MAKVVNERGQESMMGKKLRLAGLVSMMVLSSGCKVTLRGYDNKRDFDYNSDFPYEKINSDDNFWWKMRRWRRDRDICG